MHTRASKKREADALRLSLEQERRSRADQPPSKKFKRILLPCDNSDDEYAELRRNADLSPERSSSVANDCLGVNREIKKTVQSGKNSQEPNRTSITRGKNTKESNLNKVLVAYNLNSGKVGECNSATKTLTKNQPKKVCETKLIEPDTVRRMNSKLSEGCGDKGQSVKKVKCRREETNCVQVLVVPPKVTDKDFVVERKNIPVVKNPLKTPINQPSQITFSNNKELTKKLASKSTVSSGHENRFSEKLQTISQVEDKYKNLPNSNKPENVCKVSEKCQKKGAFSFVHGQELKGQSANRVSGVVAENIEVSAVECKNLPVVKHPSKSMVNQSSPVLFPSSKEETKKLANKSTASSGHENKFSEKLQTTSKVEEKSKNLPNSNEKILHFPKVIGKPGNVCKVSEKCQKEGTASFVHGQELKGQSANQVSGIIPENIEVFAVECENLPVIKHPLKSTVNQPSPVLFPNSKEETKKLASKSTASSGHENKFSEKLQTTSKVEEKSKNLPNSNEKILHFPKVIGKPGNVCKVGEKCQKEGTASFVHGQELKGQSANQVSGIIPENIEVSAVECENLPVIKHPLKSTVNQSSPVLLPNSKEETKKLASKSTASSGHENKFSEKLLTTSRVEDKYKISNSNEKIQHFPKVTDKPGNVCKISEKCQKEGAVSFVLGQGLKSKSDNQVSGIIAENIDELMNEYEQITTIPVTLKTTTEKRNDKKLSQKKMLNMFGEEHLMEDSPFICSPSNKEKPTFPDVISTFNQFDNVKGQGNFHQENITKLKSYKLNLEKGFSNGKDISNLKVKVTKKRKLSEPMDKQRSEKSRRHSADTTVEKSTRPHIILKFKKKDETGYEKKFQTSFQKKLLPTLSEGSNDFKHCSGDKFLNSNSQICLSSSAIEKTKDIDVRNEAEQTKKTKNDKEIEIAAEKCKTLENDRKKIKRRFSVHDVISRKCEQEKLIENKKGYTSGGGSISPKIKSQVESGKFEKTKVTSSEMAKVIISEVSRHKETSGVRAKSKENLSEVSSAEKENVEQPERIEAEVIHFNNATSKGITETSSSTTNNPFNSCSIERSSLVKKSSSAISPFKIITDASNTPNNSNGNLRRSSMEKSLNQKIDKPSGESPIGDKPRKDSASMSVDAKQLELEENLAKIVGDENATQPDTGSIGDKPRTDDTSTSEELRQLELEKVVGGASAEQPGEISVHGKPTADDDSISQEVHFELEVECLAEIVGEASAKQPNASSIGVEPRADDASTNNELELLELEYERLSKVVGEASSKKYMLWRKIEILQGIQVIKKEVPDDDDCQIVPSEETSMVKEENDSSTATEVMDWLNDSRSVGQCEVLDENGSIALDSSTTAAVENSVSMEHDEVLTGNNISMLGSSSEAGISTGAQQRSGKDLETHTVDNVVDHSFINGGDSTNRNQMSVERLGSPHTSRLVSSSVSEVAIMGQQNNSDAVVSGCNVAVSSPTITMQDSCVRQKSVLVLGRSSSSRQVSHSVVDGSHGVLQNESCEAVDKNNLNKPSCSSVPVKDTSSALQGKNTQIVDGCCNNKLDLSSKGKNGSSTVTRSEESDITEASEVRPLNNAELNDSRYSIVMGKKSIRVRGIEDLLAKPSNVIATVPQGSVSESGNGCLNGIFKDKEGVDSFGELVTIMLILGKKAEEYMLTKSMEKPIMDSNAKALHILINQHCVLIHRLCKKVLASYIERPECFLSILFMEMVNKWQGYARRFNVQHLQTLLKSSFSGFLRLFSSDCRAALEREACDLLAKMNIFTGNQVQSLMPNNSETPNVNVNSHNVAVNNMSLANSNSSSSQLQRISTTVSRITNVIQEIPAVAPNSVCHGFEKNLPPIKERIHSEHSSRNTNVGQVTLQPSTTGQPKSVEPHHPQVYANSETYVNSRTHVPDNNQNVSDLSAQAVPFYRPPPNYYAVTHPKSCHQPSQPSLGGQVRQCPNVVVAQQKNSHLQQLIQMSNNAQMRNGSHSASHSVYNIQNSPNMIQDLQKSALNAVNRNKTTPPTVNNSQQAVSSQYQLHLGNYQLQPNQMPSFHASSFQQPNLTNGLDSAIRRPSVQAPSYPKPNANLDQMPHSSQRPSHPKTALQDTYSTLQHHPSQIISFNTQPLQTSSSTYQQHSPSQMQPFEISPLRVQNSMHQQHVPSQRPSFNAPSTRGLQSASHKSPFEEQAQQRHVPSQRPSFSTSSITERQSLDHRLPLSTPSLREPNSMHQQHTPSMRTSFNAASLGEPNSAHQNHPPTQHPSFIAPSLREPIPTHRLHPPSQVQISGSNNPFTNLSEYEKQTAHQPSVAQLHYYNNYESNSQSSVRQVSDWHQRVGTFSQQMPTSSYNNKNCDEVPSQFKSSQGVWHGQDQQLLHKLSLNAGTIQVGQNASDYQSPVLRTALRQHGRENENVMGKLLSPNAKSFDCLNYSGNVVQPKSDQQNGLRSTIIHSPPYRAEALQIPNRHTLPVLDQSYQPQQSSSEVISQNTLISSTHYTTNLQNQTGVVSHVYNNSTMNYMGNFGAASSRQPVLPSLASPVHDTSPGLLPEENDQIRGQAVSRSISRDSGYRSPSQGAEPSSKAGGKCGVCHKEAILTCSRCTSVFYCNTECQIGDWSRHKNECRITTS